MQLYTIPIDIECDNTKRVYKKLDMYGNILCHFERVPHPDDIHVPMDTTNKQLPNYQGQWIDLTEEKP